MTQALIPEEEGKQPVPAWRRVLVALGWFGLALLLLLAGLYGYARLHYTSRLDRLLKELDETDPTWRWEKMQAALPALQPGEDSSELVLRLSRAFPSSWPDAKLDEKLQNLQPNHKLDAPRLKALQQILAVPPVDRLREDARTLVRFPRGRIPVQMAENPIATLLPDHQNVRKLAALLRYDISERLASGQMEQVVTSLHAMLNLSNVFDDDALLIGQLIRMAVVSIALGDIQRTLGQGELSDAQLAHLQALLRHQMASTRMETAMRGERWMAHRTVEAIIQGKMSQRDLAGVAGGGGGEGIGQEIWNWLLGLGAREMARREHPHILETMNRVVAATQLPIKEQFAAEAAIEADLRTQSGTILRLLLPAITKVNEAGRRTVCAATAMHALLGVERYRLRHGTWPRKLSDCVPDFLDREPLDPIDEAPLRYKILPEGVVVYSIGNNRKDDGGAVETMRDDIGYRLWNKNLRGLAPPPLPPEPEEGVEGLPGAQPREQAP